MGEKSFNCSYCARPFGRFEHQKRHELTHIQEKPFHCATCSRGFTRRDALQRHEATHAEQYTSLLQTGARACFSCATARVKCSGSQPCERCERRGWACVHPSDGATGETLSTVISQGNSNGSLDASLDNTHPDGVYLNIGTQQSSDLNSLWDPSILASTNWLGSVDLDAFDPTLSNYDVAFTLPQPCPHASIGNGSPTPCSVAASPALTVTTGTFSTNQDKQTEEGEYYVDGQPARLPKVKRRRVSRAAPPFHGAQLAWSLQEPVFAVENSSSYAFGIGNDSHEKLRQLHQQLCLVPLSLYTPFDNDMFPSKAFFERLITATISIIAQSLHFLHHSQIIECQLHWLEIISLASLACHFAEIERKYDFTISMHEFVRRIIHWVDEQSQPVDGVDDCVLTRALIIHATGATYCGNDRLCKHALGLNARLTTMYHKLLHSHRRQDTPSRGGTDQVFIAWRNTESSTRLLYTIWLYDCMTAYHFQRKPSLGLEDASIPLPCQEKLWGVRNEDEWLSMKAQSETLLSSPPTLVEAVQQLYIDKWLPSERGEFSRALMIHALFQRSWDVEAYFKNPLSHWEPVAQRQESAEVLPSASIWLPAISSFAKWQNSACDALDILHWQANATIGQSSGLEHPTVLHLHMARVVLLAPYLDIIAQAQSMTGISMSEAKERTPDSRTVNQSSPAIMTIRRWATSHQYKARLAAIHAGVAFWHVRRYSTDAYYEASSIALAALTLWAFGTCARRLSPAAPQEPENHLSTAGDQQVASFSNDDNDNDLEPCSIILLDRPTDDELVQQFIKNGDRMEAHISGIGDLYAPQSPRLVLRQACKLLKQSEKSWGIAGKWARLLERLSDYTV
ncbi:hypothetical protein Q7P37_011493 [Cladosporium fusiforme]